MGNIVIAHGYAHRLRNDGLTESATFDNESATFGTWDIRNPEEMDLSGGDWVLIQDTLKRFRQVFQFTGRRTPTPAPKKQEKQPEAPEIV